MNWYLRRISDKLVYGNAYLFSLVMERPLEDGGDPPLYLDLDVFFMFDLRIRASINTVLGPLLNRLAEKEEKIGRIR